MAGTLDVTSLGRLSDRELLVALATQLSAVAEDVADLKAAHELESAECVLHPSHKTADGKNVGAMLLRRVGEIETKVDRLKLYGLIILFLFAGDSVITRMAPVVKLLLP